MENDPQSEDPSEAAVLTAILSQLIVTLEERGVLTQAATAEVFEWARDAMAATEVGGRRVALIANLTTAIRRRRSGFARDVRKIR